MKISLTRGGHFTARNMQGNPNSKCDLAAVSTYLYNVEIEGTDQALSPEGFIIENSRVQTYFDNKYNNEESKPFASCERIAMQAARDLGKQLVEEGISVLSVKATIGGSNGAKLSAEWTVEDYRPRHIEGAIPPAALTVGTIS